MSQQNPYGMLRNYEVGIIPAVHLVPKDLKLSATIPFVF